MPIDVVNAFNTRTVTVNQKVNGQVWISVGTYYFRRTGGSLLIRTNGTNGVVIADAVKFVSIPSMTAVVKDNNSAGVTVSGAWTTSTAIAGFYGPNYLEDGNAAVKGNHSVAYAAGNLGAAGVYEVFARWTSIATRATNARYDVLTATGIKSVTANQRHNGGKWVSLGYFDLTAAGASVTLRNNGANGSVVADGVRFVRVA